LFDQRNGHATRLYNARRSTKLEPQRTHIMNDCIIILYYIGVILRIQFFSNRAIDCL